MVKTIIINNNNKKSLKLKLNLDIGGTTETLLLH